MSDGKFRFLDRDIGLPYLWGRITAFFVKKEDGKGLSTNDFTTEEKQKLEGLQNYTLPKAQKDVLGGIKVGAGLAIDDDGNLSATGGGEADSVNWDNVIGKPTNVSEFANDAGYQTATQVDSAITAKGYQTSEQVEAAITEKGYQTASQVESAISSKGYATTSSVDSKLENYALKADVTSALKYKGTKPTYAELPTNNNAIGDVWNIEQADASHNIKAGDNVIWNGTAWDVTSGTIDLSGYVEASDLVEISTGEIDDIIESLS